MMDTVFLRLDHDAMLEGMAEAARARKIRKAARILLDAGLDVEERELSGWASVNPYGVTMATSRQIAMEYAEYVGAALPA